jgi:hypothetical protein
VAQEIKCLPSEPEALSSNTSTVKRKKKQNKNIHQKIIQRFVLIAIMI